VIQHNRHPVAEPPTIVDHRPDHPEKNAAELWTAWRRLEREARHSFRLAMFLCAVATLGGSALLCLFFLAEERLQNLILGFAIASGALLSLVVAVVVMVLANRKLRQMARLRDARRRLAREMTGAGP
jgi:hypothetical protein